MAIGQGRINKVQGSRWARAGWQLVAGKGAGLLAGRAGEAQRAVHESCRWEMGAVPATDGKRASENRQHLRRSKTRGGWNRPSGTVGSGDPTGHWAGGGNGGDSYLDEHFHVHERLGQDGETGAQEHLTGRVRHDGNRGRTDGPSDQAGPRSRARTPASLARPPAARKHARTQPRSSSAQSPPTSPAETVDARELAPGPGRGLWDGDACVMR